MANPCEIKAWVPKTAPERLLEKISLEAIRLEKKYSRYLADSVTTKINQSAGKNPIEVDDETLTLLDFANTAWHQSNGLFDLTSGVLRRAWDFKSQQLPSQPQIDALLPLVGWGKVAITNKSVYLPLKGMEIDFGGIVKEYAVDRLAAYAKSHGVQHGVVNMGGDIHVIGPEPDGTPLFVGVKDPRNPSIRAEIPILRGGMATSGDYEKYILTNGRRYCHIINPLTGWPCSEWQSVSVVAPQCVIAGFASSTAMMMLKETAQAWLKSANLAFLLIENDHAVSHRLKI